jgi:hypothetical protein
MNSPRRGVTRPRARAAMRPRTARNSQAAPAHAATRPRARAAMRPCTYGDTPVTDMPRPHMRRRARAHVRRRAREFADRTDR